MMYANEQGVEVWYPGQLSSQLEVIRPGEDGKIDFYALNEHFQNNPGLLAQIGGKTTALMAGFCHMNAFNIENFQQISEHMRFTEDNFATVIHKSNSSLDNKMQIKSLSWTRQWYRCSQKLRRE